MKQYNVKAYYKGLLRMSQQVNGKKMAEAVKRVFMKNYGFTSEEIDIVRV